MSGRDRLSAEEIEAIVTGQHADPFAVLGDHDTATGRVIRAFVPGATRLRATDLDQALICDLVMRHEAGLFEGLAPARTRRAPIRLEAARPGAAWALIDPYSFGPVLGPLDDYYLAEGSHLRLFDRLGAHAMRHEGITGVHFAVWAPNARRVAVVGPFNDWDGRRHVMRKRVDTGVFEIFVPDIAPGTLYKFEIVGADGVRLPLKADPFAFASEMRPATASKVASPAPFTWTDGDYLTARAKRDPRRVPISIYEVHLGSWRQNADGSFKSYDELAAELVTYATEMGFTHLEFLPVSEHPYDPSWGYQPTGLYAPTARFGEPDGFARLVDAAHAAGLGVILDWVPAHFPTDAHGLARFDGTALYEHEDPRQGYHPDWNTAIYNFGRREVTSYLVNNALFWLERYHIDGLRVDAVASMLYLDYSRKEGEWIANKDGGNANLEAIDFLKRMNATVYAEHPGVITIAEESTSWPGVSKPVHEGGLGFGFKWNMGFMHDTLAYMKRDAVHRKYHHTDLTFGMLYAFSENFVLPYSHDEVVHGKASLLEKMSGADDWQKFASLRALYGFLWGYPGKKLLFMGQEFGQRREWSEARGLDWDLLGFAPHQGLSNWVRDLNHLYRDLPALHARDCEAEGFRWTVVDDQEQSVIAFLRYGGEGDAPVLVVINFTPLPRHGYQIGVPRVGDQGAGHWAERLNSDAGVYGGSGVGNFGGVTADDVAHGSFPARVTITVPPLGAVFFEGGG